MEVKDRILEKAHELFMRYGIRSITMDEIAGHLGISKKTIYQSYADKDELVSAVFYRIMNENKGMCCSSRECSNNAIHEQFLCSDVVQEMFGRMNPSILFDIKRYHPKVYAEFKKYKIEFIYEMIKTSLQRGVTEGLFREDMSVEIIARLQLETITLLHEPEFVHKHGVAVIEKELNDFFLHGSATPKGKELITIYKLERQNKQ
ncbi:MAG: TetR/AcrR family transcriptional regulator [Deinococcales bacterium]|nr:TetR/AcrR family transcriptional regulator [Chitinophagaceae bacterium]